MEVGQSQPKPKFIVRMTEVFGVSEGFLCEGDPGDSPNDAFAGRLWQALTVAREFDDMRSARLMRLLEGAGYDSATAAARVHGWNPETLRGHEKGRQHIPLDRMVEYVLTLGYPPECIHADIPGEPSSHTWKPVSRDQVR